MKRRRILKEKHSHYCLLVNKSAAGYNQRYVKKLITTIRDKGSYYTIFEPDSAEYLVQAGMKACGLRRWHGAAPQQVSRRGPVTALVACGGDGTANLVAQTALKAGLPLGVVPMGKTNNIARSLFDSEDPDDAIRKVVERNYRKIDAGLINGRWFFGAAGVGFLPQLERLLRDKRRPRFGIGWSQLASRAAASVTPRPLTITIDAFRFEVSPLMLNVHLLPYGAGLPLDPAAVVDDQQAEVTFDFGQNANLFSSFARQIHKKKYVFGTEIKLFRGRAVRIQPARDLVWYLDGEQVTFPDDVVEVRVSDKQLKVFC